MMQNLSAIIDSMVTANVIVYACLTGANLTINIKRLPRKEMGVKVLSALTAGQTLIG